MGIRQLGCKLLVGGGALTGLLLGWTAIDSFCTQSVLAQERPFAPPGAPPGAPSEPRVQRNYLNKNVIRLPIEINPSQRALIQEIHLYVKESAQAPWILREKVDGSKDSFTFQAPKDGEYWFTMVTIDRKGRSVPDKVQNEGPGLIVVIDTQRPTVQVSNLGAAPEGHLIRCDARDANLDLAKTQFYFQGGDKVFRTVVPVAGLAQVYCVPKDCVWTGLIRVTAEDMAGNRVEHEEHISQVSVAQAPQPVAPPPKTPFTDVKQPVWNPPVGNPSVGNPPVGKPPVGVAPSTLPDLSRVPPLPTELRTNTMPPIPQVITPAHEPTARPNGSEGPRFDKQVHSVEHRVQTVSPAPVKRQLVNSTKLFLDYQAENVGAGGVTNVEVWITKDQSKTWMKLPGSQPSDGIRTIPAPPKSPVEVNLPGDGLYGVSLVLSSKISAGKAPAPGDEPDGWVEVDTTKPHVEFTRLESVPENGLYCVHIGWTAKDANLADVELQCATSPQGQWHTIAKDLKGSGEHRWTPTSMGTQGFLRLVVRDLAGNETVAATLQPVTIGEVARPRAILRNISTGASQPTPSVPAPPPIPQVVLPTTR